MRTLRQDAQRLNDKVIVNLTRACVIASGREKGSIFDLEKSVAIAHSWCDELLGLIIRIEYIDNADIEEQELLRKTEKQIGGLFNDICYVHKCLNGEKSAPLHEIEKNLDECRNEAKAVKQLLLSA